ncbi:cell division FtsA domain-containing protein [Desulfitobacterium sp.]|uniref:cell division protein FtsA n=1 Tax=Desulfitobacterium sp. TaxID=49981 RepID=UPI002CBFAD4A|nr:cell division FtsA domain-containing protein [Desulfitobacterium sp.]HVJ48689.1 cell division FtsA domain-containing protein [Desulfitobacterium sp.]
MKRIFALDIGTRMVMGLVMVKGAEGGYEILASAQTEHKQRAMYDGQVHDIEEVAQAVLRVKAELEQKINEPLESVAVAAAGRALKTVVTSYERSELFPVVWAREDVVSLEMEAVQKALQKIGGVGVSGAYHCVGYSTIENLLEGQKIANLVGQRGKIAEIKVITTFLPRTVVDGLLAVIQRAGLKMKSLTLEPIAAGQAAIPQDMRRMNLVLVDIGAGTADIALTKQGAFFAYGMVPMAGDEVTECLCQAYLLDFQMGEILKRSIENSTHLNFTNFLGEKTELSQSEILQCIAPVVDELANKIVSEILRLNEGIPQAVILIGGGSLTPRLREMIAEEIKLPLNRVGIQIRERIEQVFGEKEIKGPDVITPIGIGISALEDLGLRYYDVGVNKTPVSILELQQTTVADALLSAGMSPRTLLGRPGAALTFEVNGDIKLVKGDFGEPAQYFVNEQRVSLDYVLAPNDQIRFIPGVHGEAAHIRLQDVFPSYEEKNIIFNQKPMLFAPQFYVDGQKLPPDSEIIDGWKIEYHPNQTLSDLLEELRIPVENTEILHFKVSGQEQEYRTTREIFINGQRVEEDCLLRSQDQIEIQEAELRIADLDLQVSPMVFRINGEEINYPPQTLRIYSRGQSLELEDLVREGMEIRLDGYERMPILSDILPYIELSQPKGAGETLKIRVNGFPGEFTTLLHNGDRIEIGWNNPEN